MSLEHILLGMLDEPASGYDLGGAFGSSAALFWGAELSQIYPTLKRMLGKGWLECREEPSERGPARKVYRTTDTGRDELRAWLGSEPQVGRERLAFIAQTFFMGELGDLEASRSFIRQMRSRWEMELSYMEHAERLHLETEGDWSEVDLNHFHYYAALRLGLHMMRSKLAWCEEIEEQVVRRMEAK